MHRPCFKAVYLNVCTHVIFCVSFKSLVPCPNYTITKLSLVVVVIMNDKGKKTGIIYLISRAVAIMLAFCVCKIGWRQVWSWARGEKGSCQICWSRSIPCTWILGWSSVWWASGKTRWHVCQLELEITMNTYSLPVIVYLSCDLMLKARDEDGTRHKQRNIELVVCGFHPFHISYCWPSSVG